MPRQIFYEPTTGGYERKIIERLRYWARCEAVMQPLPSPNPTQNNPSTKEPST
jgi:hypothetical protein